jgi:hypothetical protein
MASLRNTSAGAFFLSFFLLVCVAKAYTVDRRQLFKAVIAGTTSVAAVGYSPEIAQAVISSKFCAYGEGDGCEDLAEGNDYIRELQARSATNKEAIQRVRSQSLVWRPASLVTEINDSLIVAACSFLKIRKAETLTT